MVGLRRPHNRILWKRLQQKHTLCRQDALVLLIALQIAVLAVLGLATWLLPIYLERRVSEAARGAVDQRVGVALANHQHELEKQSELLRQSLALTRDRFSHDYSLFAAKRNEVYAALYALLERAAGGYGGHFAVITSQREFSRSGAPVLRRLASTLEPISEDERAEFQSAIERNDLDSARSHATRLHKIASVREAYGAFMAFKNEFILNSIYISVPLESLLQKAVSLLARLSTHGDDVIDGERLRYAEANKEYESLRTVLLEVRDRMRLEMTEGFRQASDA